MNVHIIEERLLTKYICCDFNCLAKVLECCVIHVRLPLQFALKANEAIKDGRMNPSHPSLFNQTRVEEDPASAGGSINRHS